MTETPLLRWLATAVLPAIAAILLASVLVACGGGGDEDDAEALLDRAFSQSIGSADLEVDAELGIEGLPGFGEPVDVHAAGPYIDRGDELPRMDLSIAIGSGAGQTVEAGFLSTGDRAFIGFGGTWYEQPRSDVTRASRGLANRSGGSGGALSELGLEPRKWVVDARVAGSAEVSGVEVDHVEGRLDVAAMLEDLNSLLRSSADAVEASGEVPEPLGERRLKRLSRLVADPTFDVYVGKDDGVLRRISIKLEMKVPEEDRASLEGISGATLTFSAQLDDIGGDQRVEAPEGAQPMSSLTSQLGGLRALGADVLEDAGVGGDGDADPDPDDSQGGSTTEGAPGDGFQQYGECLDRARPDDDDAIARCADLLR